MRKLPLLPILFVSLGAATVAGLCYALGEPPRQSCRLPDGSRVTLEGITYGTGEHRFTPGNRLRRALGLALPPDWAALFGWEPKRYAGPSPPYPDIPRIVCWFNWQEVSEGNSPSWSLWSVSADGTETYAERDPLRIHPIGPGLIPHPVTLFPRDAPSFTLQLYDQGQGDGKYRRCAAFRVPNPEPRAASTWRPERLPASKLCGDVRVILTDLSENRFRDNPSGLPPWRTLTVGLRLRTANGKRTDWRPAEVVISDSTGNEVNPGWQRDQLCEQPDGDWCAITSAALPPGPAWKVTVRLARRRDFPAATRVSVPIPPPGKTLTLNRKVRVEGGYVVLERIRAPGEIANAGWSHSLDVHLKGFDEPYATVRGFEHSNILGTANFSPQAGPMTWSLWPDPKARTFSLTFERQHTSLPVTNFRTVEFLATPTVK